MHPCALHPLAWWAWALALAVAATRVSDMRVVTLLLAVVVTVVLVRRDDSPWARSFDGYLALGVATVVMRVLFHIVVGIKTPGPVVLDLPRVATPDWAVGISLFGPVTTTGLVDAASAGLRLALLIICFGAATALANPKRALRTLPASMHHVGTAVVIAVSVTPQLVTATQAIRRAQRLRGTPPRGVRTAVRTAAAVLTDALDRSLALAASMDSRGYARTLPGRSDRRVGILALAALLSAALGTYGLLAAASSLPGLGILAAGAVAAATASVLAGRQVRRSRYRPDSWGIHETVVALAGLAPMVLLVVSSGAQGAFPVVVAMALALACVPVFHPWETTR